MSEQKNKLLEVKDLKVSFFTPAGEVKAVGGISYDLDYGEVMGVVGESGSGKSQEAYSIMGLLQSPGKVIGGSITFEGKDDCVPRKQSSYDLPESHDLSESGLHHRKSACGSSSCP